MFNIGAIIGGIIAVWILSWVWEWALFKRVFDDPVKGKLGSVAAAFVTVSILAGFGFADGGPWRADASLLYLPGLAIVGVFAYRRGLKVREQPADDIAVSEVFD